MKLLTKTVISIILLFSLTTLTAQIRYVSKTGSSTPPYTSWATASDSIQKCIDICNDGDTVIVGNGVYKESIIINAEITLIGSSMDSCVIDGTGLASGTIKVLKQCEIKGFNIIGKERGNYTRGILDGNIFISIDVSDCRISNCYEAIAISRQSGVIKNIFVNNVNSGIRTFCASDTCKPKLYNSVIIIHKEGENAWYTFDGGQPTIVNNIMVTEGRYLTAQGAASGINYAYDMHKNLTLTNNIFAGFGQNRIYTINDSATIINNIIAEKGKTSADKWALAGVSHASKTRNNILINNDKAVRVFSVPDLKYNLFWNNQYNINSPYQIDSTDIIADPMFVKDTLGYTLKADYHLQKYSPAIDTGDPDILDIDGTRSDIGLYGGPLGKAYKYLDLPPRAPKDFIITIDTISKNVILSWKMNTENDFKNYIIYRSDKPDFQLDSTTKYSEIPIAFYIDTLTTGYEKLYYRITAIDRQGNESVSGQLITVVLVGIEGVSYEILTDYTLYQNYPNPFNSATRINFGLKERGYVKLMIYTLTGELVITIVNGEKEAGFYETEVDLRYLASGIYLYRIEIIGEGGIPKFMDMKKMLMLK